ncbi:helix-turn-helix domain-containing protein [Streptomyces sp. NPDC059247]|uniref:helix-turn-helix domain-containing protein n=1 Tax=Streptomyces sp. NPDC059247 TaxID=3346790 RepID=UPI0036B81EB3
MTVGTHHTHHTHGTHGMGITGVAGVTGADERGGACPGCEGCGATPWTELAAEMRRIKGDAELSYGQLAQRTHYSRSSWERFLNQKQLPTRIAVEQFAAAAGQDPRPLLIRLELSLAYETAARAGGGRADGPPGADRAAPHVHSARPDGRGDLVPPLQPLGLVAVGALVGGLVTLLARAARSRRQG